MSSPQDVGYAKACIMSSCMFTWLASTRLLQPMNLHHAAFSWWMHTSWSTDTIARYKRAACGMTRRQSTKEGRWRKDVANTRPHIKTVSSFKWGKWGSENKYTSCVRPLWRYLCGRTTRAIPNTWTQAGPLQNYSLIHPRSRCQFLLLVQMAMGVPSTFP